MEESLDQPKEIRTHEGLRRQKKDGGHRLKGKRGDSPEETAPDTNLKKRKKCREGGEIFLGFPLYFFLSQRGKVSNFIFEGMSRKEKRGGGGH